MESFIYIDKHIFQYIQVSKIHNYVKNYNKNMLIDKLLHMFKNLPFIIFFVCFASNFIYGFCTNYTEH